MQTLGVLSAIEFLHSKNVIVGDVFPDLIAIDNDNAPFLLTFGTQTLFPELQADSQSAKYLFSAPEMQNRNFYTMKTDIFAFAMLVLRIFSRGQLLWKKEAATLTVSNRLSAGFRPIYEDKIPLFIQNLIEFCWATDPGSRISAYQAELKFLNDSNTYLKASKLQLYNQYEASISSALYDPIDQDCTNFVMKINQLSVKGKKLAIRYINIQEHILGVTYKNFTKVFNWLKNNVDPETDFDHLLNFFSIASFCRYATLDVISRLFIAISKQFQQFNNLPITFLKVAFSTMEKTEPLPGMMGTMNFIFYLYCNNAYKAAEIVEEIKNLFERPTNSKNACLAFCWFANVVHDLDKDLFDRIFALLKDHADDDFFHEQYRAFYNNFAEYSKDNFAFYKNVLPDGYTLDKLTNFIRVDDAQEFHDIVQGFPLPIKFKVPCNIFEPCSFACDSTFCQLYTLLYSSQRIFQQLILNKTASVPNEKPFRKIGHYAVAGGSEPFVRYVLETRGEAANGCPQVAATYHRNNIFNTILKYHPDMTEPDKDGKLVITASAASNNIYMLLQCLQTGVSITTRETFGWTTLHAAAEKGRDEVLEILLEVDQVDVNAADIWGCTPLHVAVDRKQISITKILLKAKGINVNAQNEDGKTPFHLAVQNCCIPIIELFLKKRSVRTSIKTSKGQNALHIAASTGNVKVFELIAKSTKINPEEKDLKGRTPYDIAKSNNFEDILKLCEEQAKLSGREDCRV